jgi:ribosomal protein L11 methyltransferase
MNQYLQVEFAAVTSEQKDILIAELADAGFEGFEEGEDSLKSFIPVQSLDEDALNAIASQQKLSFTKTIIEETNWNQVWESNFEPVTVDDFVAIRAHFHQPITSVAHEIVITPKMSFGTGHHATTYMMMMQMRSIDFVSKSVFDFGTGTGVLAILAEKLGAKKIDAIDIDEWSITNAKENIEQNNCSLISLKKADTAEMTSQYDIILANINKNVIIDSFPVLARQLSPGGILLLSGLLVEDEDDIFHISSAYSLQIIQTSVRANWLCLRLSC